MRNDTVPVLKASLASGSVGAGCSKGTQVSMGKEGKLDSAHVNESLSIP